MIYAATNGYLDDDSDGTLAELGAPASIDFLHEKHRDDSQGDRATSAQLSRRQRQSSSTPRIEEFNKTLLDDVPSVRDLRDRIRSMKNTQQITKAMKQVAAAKIRRAELAQKQRVRTPTRSAEMLRDLMRAVSSGRPSVHEAGRDGRAGRRRSS